MNQRTRKPTVRPAASKDSDQPALSRCLIRVFADHMCLQQPPGYQKRDKREPLPDSVDVSADHTGLVLGFVVRWHKHVYVLQTKSVSLSKGVSLRLSFRSVAFLFWVTIKCSLS